MSNKLLFERIEKMYYFAVYSTQFFLTGINQIKIPKKDS